MTPAIVAVKPIMKPVKKNDFIMDFFDKPNAFKIAISLVLFLIKIVSPEIILNAATIMIKVNIKNITFLSTFKADKKIYFDQTKNLQINLGLFLVFHFCIYRHLRDL